MACEDEAAGSEGEGTEEGRRRGAPRVHVTCMRLFACATPGPAVPRPPPRRNTCCLEDPSHNTSAYLLQAPPPRVLTPRLRLRLVSQASAAAFAKALLDLEGTSLTPILVSLVKKDASMLDAFGKGASDDINDAKNVVYEVRRGEVGVCEVGVACNKTAWGTLLDVRESVLQGDRC